MGASSTRKGKVGEREWASWLREHLGATVSRGQQGGGGHNDPDVKGLAGWWCEVKRVERFSVWAVLAKLAGDLAIAIDADVATSIDKPMVAFRRNRGRWWVILRAEDWAGLLIQVEQGKVDAEKLRQAIKDSYEARRRRGRLSEVEKDRDQARLDAGIWERRVREAAEHGEVLEAELVDVAHSRDGWKAQAEGLAASSKALEKAMAAELERVAR